MIESSLLPPPGFYFAALIIATIFALVKTTNNNQKQNEEDTVKFNITPVYKPRKIPISESFSNRDHRPISRPKNLDQTL